ncbi:MAG: hypothetical protein MJZ37_05045 [Bacilli bacterium]|nr:hypothetical protein [Bacilli bacterium]
MKKLFASWMTLFSILLTACNSSGEIISGVDEDNEKIENNDDFGNKNDKNYDPNCGYVRGYLIYVNESSSEKAYNIYENLSEDMDITEGNDGPWIYLKKEDRYLPLTQYIYAADVNCDGHVELIYGNHITYYANGSYAEFRNNFSIYDVHNCIELWNSDDFEGGVKPYLEEGEIMALSLDDINWFYRRSKYASLKFKINANNKIEYEKTLVPFDYVGFKVSSYKDLTDELAVTYINKISPLKDARCIVNSFDEFEFTISLDYVGDITLNNSLNRDVVTFYSEQIETVEFISYVRGDLKYKVKFKSEAEEYFDIGLKIGDRDSTIKIWLNDDMPEWTKNAIH